jgi:hypothetical protein
MSEEDPVTRFLKEMGAAQDDAELTAIAAGIEEAELDEQALERLTDALREARERLRCCTAHGSEPITCATKGPNDENGNK